MVLLFIGDRNQFKRVRSRSTSLTSILWKWITNGEEKMKDDSSLSPMFPLTLSADSDLVHRARLSSLTSKFILRPGRSWEIPDGDVCNFLPEVGAEEERESQEKSGGFILNRVSAQLLAFERCEVVRRHSMRRRLLSVDQVEEEWRVCRR